MNRLTRDGIAEPISRDQILRRERGQELFAQLTTSGIGKLTRLIRTLATCMCDNTYMHIYVTTAVSVHIMY